MSNTTEVKVPDIGDFDKVPVIEVLVSEGDTVSAEQSLITLESDKATMEIPSPAAGRVAKVLVSEGDEVSEGDPVVELEAAEEADGDGVSDKGEERDSGLGTRDSRQDGEAEDGKGEVTSDDSGDKQDSDEGRDSDGGRDSGGDGDEEDGEGQVSSGESGGRKPPAGDTEDLPPPPVPYDDQDINPAELPHASPSVRRLARELGVDLTGVSGSGRKGRITEDDLKGHVKQRMEGAGGGAPAGAAGGMGVAPPPEVDFSKFGETETVKLSRIQLKSGPALHRNWVSIPHVTQFDEADITEMEAFRKGHSDMARAEGVKLTPLVFLLKASVAALRAFPHVNASLTPDGQSLVYKHYFHIGVAVDTENGLVVPVIRDVDQKGLMDLARELGEVSEKARAGKLSAADMQGGCFSISSLGGIGGTAFTPIINAPEVAILGVSRASVKPVWNGEEFEGRLMLPLSFSYDHRVVDGADAARFTRHLAETLGDIRRLLL